MSQLRILCIGDVVGPLAVAFLERRLWQLRTSLRVDFTVLNAENAAPGDGTDPQTARALFAAGADVLTGGNHTFQKRSLYAYLEQERRILRPANYPPDCPGSGYTIETIQGLRLLCINVNGTVFMQNLACPFRTVSQILQREDGKYDLALLDIHAEATSEKIALGQYFDGRIQVIYGTHTHVPTADEQILPHGSGYITDVGMTGPEHHSVLGVKTECVIDFLTKKMPRRFEPADGPLTLRAALFTVDTQTRRTVQLERITIEE